MCNKIESTGISDITPSQVIPALIYNESSYIIMHVFNLVFLLRSPFSTFCGTKDYTKIGHDLEFA